MPAPEDFASGILRPDQGVALAEFGGGCEAHCIFCFVVGDFRNQVTRLGSRVRTECFPEYLYGRDVADRFFAVALYGREAILSCIRDDVAVCGACVVEGSPQAGAVGRSGFILLAPRQQTGGTYQCHKNVKQ